MSYSVGKPVKLRKKKRIALKRMMGTFAYGHSGIRLAAQKEWQKLHDAGIIFESCMACQFVEYFGIAVHNYLGEFSTPAQAMQTIMRDDHNWLAYTNTTNTVHAARLDVCRLGALAGIRYREKLRAK